MVARMQRCRSYGKPAAGESPAQGARPPTHKGNLYRTLICWHKRGRGKPTATDPALLERLIDRRWGPLVFGQGSMVVGLRLENTEEVAAWVGHNDPSFAAGLPDVSMRGSEL